MSLSMLPWWVPISRFSIMDEAHRLADLIDQGFAQGLPMDELCAAYKTLHWVLDPDGHAPPHTMGAPPPPPEPKLRVVK